MSLDLYISESSLVIGTFPMVFLKNTSSIVDGLIERKAGNSNKSFPKRQGCVGYLEYKNIGNLTEVFRISLKVKLAYLMEQQIPESANCMIGCYLWVEPLYYMSAYL